MQSVRLRDKQIGFVLPQNKTELKDVEVHLRQKDLQASGPVVHTTGACQTRGLKRTLYRIPLPKGPYIQPQNLLISGKILGLDYGIQRLPFFGNNVIDCLIFVTRLKFQQELQTIFHFVFGQPLDGDCSGRVPVSSAVKKEDGRVVMGSVPWHLEKVVLKMVETFGTAWNLGNHKGLLPHPTFQFRIVEGCSPETVLRNTATLFVNAYAGSRAMEDLSWFLFQRGLCPRVVSPRLNRFEQSVARPKGDVYGRTGSSSHHS